jgi:cobalt-precorrin-5B (C1)-methyltransferase
MLYRKKLHTIMPIPQKNRALREGFTTGTAASAAAAVAVRLLLGAPLPPTVRVALPPFALRDGRRYPQEIGELDIPIEQGAVAGDNLAWASVVKDGGDDPDATHGMRLVALASREPFTDAASDRQMRDFAPEAGTRVTLPDYLGADLNPRGRPVAVSGFSNPVFLYGGKGIGVATLPGLPIEPGEPAINPEPRWQIAHAACQAARLYDCEYPLHIMIAAPDGAERAKHTLNGRMGIVGGVSVLGTRGIVRPFSHEAWTATIDEALNLAAALGIEELLFSTGRRSERLGFGLYPNLPPQAGVQVADFAAYALRGAARRPFRRLRWLCFPGKLLKLAQGLEWTHAKSAEADIPLLARLCRECGAPEATAGAILGMPTAAGAFDLLERYSVDLRDRALKRLADMAIGHMCGWLGEGGEGAPGPALSLYVFSADERLLLRVE